VLVDGPQSITGISRQVISLKRLSLTDLVVTNLPKNARLKSITTGWTEQKTLEKWQASAWAKKLSAKKLRSELNDFGRFKLMLAKKEKSKAIAAALN
jgi:large subunit ribosomal protein L14e